MAGTEQTNLIALAIHDKGEKVRNVATKYTDIHGFGFLEGGESASKDCHASIIAAQLNGGINVNRGHNAAYTL